MRPKLYLLSAILLTILALYLSGVRVLNTYGTSMLPELETGDLILIFPKNPSDVEVGDIVTYKKTIDGKTYLITHRVVEKTSEAIITKGDNLPREDEPVSYDSVVGVYVAKIPKLGLLGSVVRTLPGYLLLILIPGIALLIMEIRSIVGELK
ncbi:signal peptidase I [Archaeoglobus fulgidus]|uniref:Signal peptidase I, archaeal type n=2 Tax=Archaeoglobus fulgidus TaxID=2234 RepID=A0A075WHL7_ARCFL|nr:signal peptidase I [Archaeoglobus fulgidus]AIG98659.1 signal peptidase I, archaeal type [Archaeoglobus fulgidus DSM 8774]KUJ93489.1 MAG: Signal sequence peptidase (Spc21) [Archaeoglobus fulgidus]KUK05621.1 MAG: Signal sequence peptidase (Spc21) [Archaeoglobus fulgidus]